MLDPNDDQITIAPWTPEEVQALNNFQVSGFHPFTCCSHNECDRLNQPNQGTLVAKEEGWECPCGNWKQTWAHKFMLEVKP